MPPLWCGHPDYDTARDFQGYGETGLNPKWPNDAKIAVSFVINYEEVRHPPNIAVHTSINTSPRAASAPS